jgi:hypothetical protein
VKIVVVVEVGIVIVDVL